MPRRLRIRLVLSAIALLLVAGAAGVAWHRPAPAPVAQRPSDSYASALRQAHEGQPGAARLLYQQLQRDDLPAVRRAALFAELPNYPSPQAFTLAQTGLNDPDRRVRLAAVTSLRALLPPAQRSLVLGPLLDDDDVQLQYAAVDALLGLAPDDIGVYFRPFQAALERYEAALQGRPDDPDAQVHLARLFLHEASYPKAEQALQRGRSLDPSRLDAVAVTVRLLEEQGRHDASRQVLADALAQQPDSAFLQYQLGRWLSRHDQAEYALLALSRAVELAPDDTEYRYTLAVALHALEQVEAAQRQLEALLAQRPADRRARLLLVRYWQETGQLQNVQVLLAELERLNPDDPALQQGL